MLAKGKRARKMRGIDYDKIANAWFPIVVSIGLGFLIGKMAFDKSSAISNPRTIPLNDTINYGDSTYIMTSKIDSVFSNGTEDYVPDSPSR